MGIFHFDVLSLYPNAFSSFYELGIIGRAFSNDIAELQIHNPRDFTLDNYRKVDDEPYGGGPGMVLKPEPFFAAFESIAFQKRRRVLLMSPQGKHMTQKDFYRWSRNYDQLIFICGNYEGFDERIRTLADEEISLGDFVLTGGEIPTMAAINGVLRLLPGTLGSADSLENESHNNCLLEHPHYTRPADFRGLQVPNVLKSGNHYEIALWRQKQRERRTKYRRPDLYEKWLSLESSFRSTLTKFQFNSVQLRIGNGYDMHRLVSGRPLILGGVHLEHPEKLGLEGHSDADVLSHAVMDALLGALSLGDIGKYFPPEDAKWKDSDSLILLEKVVSLVTERGWNVINIDSVVVAERPKLKPYIDEMRKNIAQRIGLDFDLVGVKATTNERLGAEGREEGISCHAVVLLGKE